MHVGRISIFAKYDFLFTQFTAWQGYLLCSWWCSCRLFLCQACKIFVHVFFGEKRVWRFSAETTLSACLWRCEIATGGRYPKILRYSSRTDLFEALPKFDIAVVIPWWPVHVPLMVSGACTTESVGVTVLVVCSLCFFDSISTWRCLYKTVCGRN